MTPKHTEHLILSLVVAAMVLFGAWKIHGLIAAHREKAAERVQKTAGPRENPALPALHVLFVGNSYTFIHNMPMMLPWIAASAPDAKYRFSIEMDASGGETLAQHAQDRALLMKITAGGYAAVVLQEQSTTFLYTDAIQPSIEAFGFLGQAVKNAGAVPFLYGTWPRKRGDAFYHSQTFSNFTPPSGPEDMMNAIDRHYTLASQASGAGYIPVGRYFLLAEQANPAFNLYEPDGSHPNAGGSYLAALVLYRALAQASPLKVAWAPHEIPPAEAEFLRGIAAR